MFLIELTCPELKLPFSLILSATRFEIFENKTLVALIFVSHIAYDCVWSLYASGIFEWDSHSSFRGGWMVLKLVEKHDSTDLDGD